LTVTAPSASASPSSAVIVAVPSATALIWPAASTVATAGFEEANVK